MAKPSILAELPKRTREALAFYWQTRSRQVDKQRKVGTTTDQGLRCLDKVGAQMNGFTARLMELVAE